jgi:hypothetical protein
LITRLYAHFIPRQSDQSGEPEYASFAYIKNEQLALKMMRGAWELDYDNFPQFSVAEIAGTFDEAVATIAELATNTMEVEYSARQVAQRTAFPPPFNVFDVFAPHAREVGGPKPFHNWLCDAAKTAGHPPLDKEWVIPTLWKFLRLDKHTIDADGLNIDERVPHEGAAADDKPKKRCCTNYGKGHKTNKARICLQWDGTVRKRTRAAGDSMNYNGKKKKTTK